MQPDSDKFGKVVALVFSMEALDAVCGGPWWHREKDFVDSARDSRSTLTSRSTDSTGTSDGCVFHCWENVEKECTIVESSSHQDKDLHSQSHFKNEDLQKVFAYQEMYNNWEPLRHKSQVQQASCWLNCTPLVLLPAKCSQGTCHISWKPNFPGIGFGPRDRTIAGTIAIKDQACTY